MPATGTLCQAFGRKGVALVSITIFCAGSAVCGATKSVEMLIAGRGTYSTVAASGPNTN